MLAPTSVYGANAPESRRKYIQAVIDPIITTARLNAMKHAIPMIIKGLVSAFAWGSAMTGGLVSTASVTNGTRLVLMNDWLNQGCAHRSSKAITLPTPGHSRL